MLHAHLRSAAKLLGYPLQPVPLIAIVFFTLGFALAAMAGLLGLPLFALLVVWLAKYVFIVVENSAQGRREPPVLSREMINPFGESRHLLLLGVLAIYAGFAAWLGGMLGRDAMLLFLWAVALLLPASIALLTVEQRLLPALDPLRMLRLAAALRWRYALLWLAVAGCVSLPALAPLLIRQPLLLVVVWIYGVLLCAHAFGRVLYEGRDAIGLDVEIEPDRVLARLRRERWQRIERVLDEVWRQARQGKLRAAYAALLTGLEEEVVDTQERIAVHERLLGWDDRSLALAHARDWLGELVRGGETPAAWRLCADCLSVDARFRPADADAAFALAKFALEGGDTDRALLLLEDFDTHYDGRGPIQAAALLAIRVLLDRRDDAQRAGQVIDRLRARFGAAGLRPELAAYAATVDLRPPPAPSRDGRG
ncbi:MAG TPA: hypothetical protein VM616_06835 [Gammaproteobacteria bacterium]|nr:hypothetical protein [Gammaproteobacteria bacterium]